MGPDIDPEILQQLVAETVAEFGTPEMLETWVTLQVPEDNVHNILTGAGITTRVKNLFLWANANGLGMTVLQRLADRPPAGSRSLQYRIFLLTRGRVRPAGNNLPPVAPHDSLFVTQRPFANRVSLRAHLQTLEMAGPGADSVLVIDGPKRSGKSHSIRLAKMCAPRQAFRPVDFSNWGSGHQVYAWGLAEAIYPQGGTELAARSFDPTKEDAAVPSLFTWLSGKLHPGPHVWILLDHCSGPNLTRAAADLLFRLAAAVEQGSLPEVRLVIADVASVNLPPAIKTGGRWDTADLPDRNAVHDWCTTAATTLFASGALTNECTPTEIDAWVDSVFEGLPVPPTREALVELLEIRLTEAYQKIKSH